MKMKRMLSLLLAVMLLGTLLCGCGGASSSTTRNEAYDAAEMEMSAEAPAAAAEAGNGATALPESRKWIITMDLSAETEDLDAMTAALDQRIAALGGYVEGQSVYNGSRYNGSRRYRSASLTIRVPADRVEEFTEDVGGISNIVRQSKTVQDVTLSYVATENRLKALETEEARLLELLSQAENMTDLLEIESRLTDVRYELENAASQKRLYDNQIDYATIYLNIEEVQEYTPVEEPNLWERISNGFTGNLKNLGEDLLDVLVWLIVSLPYLAVAAVVIFLIVLLIHRLRRRKEVKKVPRTVKKDEETKE